MKREQIFRLVIVIAGVAGLVLQFQVSASLHASRGAGIGATLLKMASYFTVLTNVLLVVVQGIGLAAPESKPGRICRSPAMQGGLLLHIIVVGIVYNTILYGLWNPQGKQWWADNLLHRVTPLLQLGFWIACVAKVKLAWRLAIPWLAWPAAYLVWALARGGDYPYPFLEVDRLGWARTVVNCLIMAGGFLAGAWAVIGIGRRMAG